MISREDRLSSAETVLFEANRITQNSQVTSARYAWLHLAKHGVVAAPQLSQDRATGAFELLWTLNGNEKTLPDPVLTILPIAEEDATLGMPYSRLWEVCSTQALAMYIPSGNLIIFRYKSDETDFVRGCTILHEAGHALRAYKEARLGQEAEGMTPSLLLEEVAMHTQDYQLWEEQGGSDYSEVIKQAVGIIRQEYSRLKTNRAFIPLEAKGPWLEVLESALGPAPTQKRQAARVWQFGIHAHFSYADQQPWSLADKMEHKTLVMKLLYTNLVSEAGKRII